METMAFLLEGLDQRHRLALAWFVEHAGTEQSWPQPLADGTLLLSKAQGIYKPRWMSYALSIRQNLAGPYADREPTVRPDGTWSYEYAREAADPNSRDSDYANRALESCIADRVPIGVVRQVRSKPTSAYRVWGLALVVSVDNRYFYIAGFSREGRTSHLDAAGQVDALVSRGERELARRGEFDPSTVRSERERSFASIIRRRGQPQFRQSLLDAYGRRCREVRALPLRQGRDEAMTSGFDRPSREQAQDMGHGA